MPNLTVFHKGPAGVIRLSWASELLFRPTAPGQDPRHVRRPWLAQLLARRTTKVAAVALANKTGTGNLSSRPGSAGPPPPNEVGETADRLIKSRHRMLWPDRCAWISAI